MTALPLVIILATVALVCVVAWTQAAIWRRLDRMEQEHTNAWYTIDNRVDAHKRAAERAITQLQDSLSAAGIPAHTNRKGQP